MERDPPRVPDPAPVDTADAVALIGGAVPRGPAKWADLGAGEGTFTRALWELLGTGSSRIYAVDKDARALGELSRWADGAGADVTVVEADFTRAAALSGLDDDGLDGILLANALHFVADAETVLKALVGVLRPGGRVAVVEYDRRRASRWVPFPVPPARLALLAKAVGLSVPEVVATRPSAFGGTLYAAVAVRSG